MTSDSRKGVRMLAAIIASLFAVAVFTGCTSKSNDSGLAGPATSQPADEHWIHDQRLRLLMAKLSKRNPYLPTDGSPDPQSNRRGTPEGFVEVAAIANAIMVAADQLPGVTATIKMNEADRSGFLAQARNLHQQAERLRDAARQERIDQMQLHMASLDSSCISCHTEYREFSGDINKSLELPTDSTQTRKPAQ